MDQGEHKSGKKHGPWVSYYAAGTLQREGSYDEGVKVGRWLNYHKNGQLRSDASFENGLYTGYYCAYHENGQKFREGYYNPIQGNSGDGRKEGVWRGWAPDGTLQAEHTYRRGAKVKPKPEGLRPKAKKTGKRPRS